MRLLGAAVGTLTGFSLSGEEKQVYVTGNGMVLVQSFEPGVGRDGAIAHLLAPLPGLSRTALAASAFRGASAMRNGRG